MIDVQTRRHRASRASAALRRRRRADRRRRHDARRRHASPRASTSATAPRSSGRSAPGCRSGCSRRGHSGATAQRAAQLAIRIVAQGVASKLAAYEQILRDAGSEDAAVAYMGDDLLDLPVLRASACRPRPRCGAPRSASASTGSAPLGGGRGAVRELIELVLRAQGRWDDVLARLRDAGADGRNATSCSRPVALLAGLAIGKAWERYKLQDGRWIDRRRARESPHYMLGLNFLVANQIDPAIEELTQAARERRRPARNPSDPRQPLPGEGTGRPRHPGASGAAAAAEPPQARARQRPALPRPRLQARRLRRSRARGVHRSAAARPRQPVRAVESREAVRRTAPVGGGLRDAAEAGAARRTSRRKRAIRQILAFLENELGLQALKRMDYAGGGAALRGGDRARPAQRAGVSEPRRRAVLQGDTTGAIAAWERLVERVARARLPGVLHGSRRPIRRSATPIASRSCADA